MKFHFLELDVELRVCCTFENVFIDLAMFSEASQLISLISTENMVEMSWENGQSHNIGRFQMVNDVMVRARKFFKLEKSHKCNGVGVGSPPFESVSNVNSINPDNLILDQTFEST